VGVPAEPGPGCQVGRVENARVSTLLILGIAAVLALLAAGAAYFPKGRAPETAANPAVPGALSHQPFLLLSTWLTVEHGFNKFNTNSIA
jgi:hypothetical protein